MKSRLALLNTVLIIFIIVGFGILFRGRIIGLWDDWMVNDTTPEPVAFTNFLNTNAYDNTNDNANINANVNIEPEPIVLPEEINLDVPFTSQAPHSNWDLPYQEACEEASAITVHYYYQSKAFTKDIADQEIKDLVAWEEENLGFYKDTTAAETAKFIKDYWGYKKVELIYDPTIKDIKIQIASGRPVIVPAAGRELGNPNFTSPGPLFHMLVVRGYTDSKFITNDVGTRNGENFQYDYDVLMDSIHDWNDGDVYNGQRVIIVVWPNN